MLVENEDSEEYVSSTESLHGVASLVCYKMGAMEGI